MSVLTLTIDITHLAYAGLSTCFPLKRLEKLWVTVHLHCEAPSNHLCFIWPWDVVPELYMLFLANSYVVFLLPVVYILW